MFAAKVHEAGTLNTLDASQASPAVMDRGFATEESLRRLCAQGFRDIAVSRERNREFDFADAHSIRIAPGQEIKLQRTLDPDTGKVRLHCFPEERAAKEEGIAARFEHCPDPDSQEHQPHPGAHRPSLQRHRRPALRDCRRIQ